MLRRFTLIFFLALTFGSALNVLTTILPLRRGALIGWILEFNSNFSEYYFLAHSLVLIAFGYYLLQQRAYELIKTPIYRTLIACSLVFVVFYGSEILVHLNPIETAQSAEFSNRHSIKFLYANVLRANREYVQMKELLEKEMPDVVATVEAFPEWLERTDLTKHYPYTIDKSREDDAGASLHSKFPLEKLPSPGVADGLYETIVAKMKGPDRSKDLCIGVLHFVPPLEFDYPSSLKMLQKFHESLAQCPEPTIVLTDLNATPYSPYFRDFAEKGFVSAQRGSGASYTWNAFYPLLRFTIDHALVRGDLAITDFKVGPAIGSDHFPLIVRAEMPE